MLANLSIGRKIALGVSSLLLILLLQGISAFWGNYLLSATQVEHNRSLLLLEAIAGVNGSLAEVQSGMRGYIISGEKDFSTLYSKGLMVLEEDRSNLRNRIYTPRQNHQVGELDRLIPKYLEIASKRIALMEKQGFEAAREAINTREGKNLIDQARKILDAMSAEEKVVQKGQEQAIRANTNIVNTLVFTSLGSSLAIGILVTLYLSKMITGRVATLLTGVQKVGAGEYAHRLALPGEDEFGRLGEAFNQMSSKLQQINDTLTQKDWLQGNLVKIISRLQGQRELGEISRIILSSLAEALEVRHGVVYSRDHADSGALAMCASYGYMERKNLSNRFLPGQGLVGQCALEGQRILLTQVPPDYIKITSGLGEASPLNVAVTPAMFDRQVRGVLEVASFHRFTENQLALLDQVGEILGNTLNWLEANRRTNELLMQSQAQGEELQSQQEELKNSNALLEEQASSLEDSTRKLQLQQTQLQESNETLKSQAQELSEQKTQLETRNQEIEQTKLALEERAEQLAITSKYKSDFLANMSHELRTPLNSLLILSELLADNKDGNLTQKQTEFARIIHNSGSDLLALINEILDMARIESGKMTVELSDMTFPAVKTMVEETFRPVADKKHLEFAVELAGNLPPAIRSDWKRLQQVLKNLLSNSFKFTEKGRVGLTISVATTGWSPECETLSQAKQVIGFAVNDTGIGIPADKMKVIFEPFQQADTSTSRKYGGTGLGLSISREIARLLGGEIRAVSMVGQGSVFTLYLPVNNESEEENPEAHGLQPVGLGKPLGLSKSQPLGLETLLTPPLPNFAALKATIQPGARVLLIIEDDPSFTNIVADLAREKGFQILTANNGLSGLAMAQQLKPDAITLDIVLPDLSGWEVLEQLKSHPDTKQIPVHIISIVNEEKRGLEQGAVAYLLKPVSKHSLNAALDLLQKSLAQPLGSLLVVEDNEGDRRAIFEILADMHLLLSGAENGQKALDALHSQKFDAMILDLGLPDISGFEILDTIRHDPALKKLPVIVYTAKDLSPAEQSRLAKEAQSVVIKGSAAPRRLLEEVALFLHTLENKSSDPDAGTPQVTTDANHTLKGRKILVVDDDVRNLVSLKSLLEHHGLEVFQAENGRDALEFLEKTPGTDIVIMDIMMPGMDGYETTQAIRKIERFKNLPVIALTAKAMKEDREKCLEAGCSDYLTKPLDPKQLLSLLRVWLFR